MIDFQTLLYDPIYLVQGVLVTLTLSAANGGTVYEDLTAVDKTIGADVGDKGAQVQTIKPVAALRVRELLDSGLTVAKLSKAKLQMNDFEWTVTSYKLIPSPRGENDGEVLLILAGKTLLDSESE